MWEAIGDDYVHEVTNVTAQFSGEFCETQFDNPNGFHDASTAETGFVSHSDLPISLGWKSIEHTKPEEEDAKDEPRNIIPANLEQGRSVILPSAGPATLKEGATKPPKPFTEATLLAAMEHASRYVEDKELKAALDDDESHSGGIGTPATRAEVIEKLIRSAYVERKGKQLCSTQSGRNLISVTALNRKSVESTALMEQQLTGVEHGEQDAETVMEQFRKDARSIAREACESVETNGRIIHAKQVKQAMESYGPCPKCGQPVIRKGKFWQCSTNKREKQSDGTYVSVGGKHRVHVKGFTSRAGRKFDADLIPDPERGAKLDFSK